MLGVTIYKATHCDTGEEVVGNAEELARKLDISAKSINRAALTGVYIKQSWMVVKVERGYVEKTNVHYPKELLAEWDAVTKPFKKAYRKARERKEKLEGKGE